MRPCVGMNGWMDGWMDGVVLIRCFDGWMDLYGSGRVISAAARDVFFLIVFLYRFLSLLDRFWDGFGRPKPRPKSIFGGFFFRCGFLSIFCRSFNDFCIGFLKFLKCVLMCFMFYFG